MKPFKSALFVFAILFALSCEKKTAYIDPNDPTGANGNGNGGGSGSGGSQTNNATYYAKGKLDGVSFNWQVTEKQDSYSFGSAARSSLGNGIAIGGVSGTISKIVTHQLIQPVLEVEFRTMKVSYEDDKFAYLQNFINTGSWAFDQANDYAEGSKKVWIRYVDKNGKEYLSATGVQAGSTANVTLSKVVPGQLGIPPSLDVRISISCKLYPVDGTGSAVDLSDAELSLNIFNMI